MQGNIVADLTTMPIVNMLVLFGGTTGLLIVAAFIIRKLGIKNIGPIKIEQQSQSTMHYMNEETKNADDNCRRLLRQITSNMKSNVFTMINVCAVARAALSSAIRFPLYESVANNHFTRELMPENFDIYRERIIDMMKDEYISLSTVSKDVSCGREPIPEWGQIAGPLEQAIDVWLKRISREVMLNCERKIAIYKRYRHDFEKAHDVYRLDIVDSSIKKNEGYIQVLKKRVG